MGGDGRGGVFCGLLSDEPNVFATKKGAIDFAVTPFFYLVPGTRIELVQC